MVMSKGHTVYCVKWSEAGLGMPHVGASHRGLAGSFTNRKPDLEFTLVANIAAEL
jgi:hypothetical protein